VRPCARLLGHPDRDDGGDPHHPPGLANLLERRIKVLDAFSRRVVASGLVPSMGSIGDCYDNAMIESFWSRMQVELLDRQPWRTRVELANAIFEYLEIFHNWRRRHSALGMLTPVEFGARQLTVVA
jgi:transposase InsO family protein